MMRSSNPAIASTQAAIAEREHLDSMIDARQSEVRHLLADMLNYAMCNDSCLKILKEAHEDMKLKSDPISEAFLQSLK